VDLSKNVNAMGVGTAVLYQHVATLHSLKALLVVPTVVVVAVLNTIVNVSRGREESVHDMVGEGGVRCSFVSRWQLPATSFAVVMVVDGAVRNLVVDLLLFIIINSVVDMVVGDVVRSKDVPKGLLVSWIPVFTTGKLPT
jgi:hypothetical protein